MSVEETPKGADTSSPPEAPPKKGRRPLWQRAAIGLLLAILAIVALVGALVLMLHTGPGQNYLRGRVETALSERVNGTARVKAVSLSLFRGTLGVSGLKLTDASQREAVFVEELSIDVLTRTLPTADRIVRRIAVQGVRLHVAIGADGTSNLSTLFKKKPEEPKPDKKKDDGPPKKSRIRVEELSLSSIAVRIDRPDGSSTHLSEVGLRGRIDATPVDKTVDATVDSITASLAIKRPDGTDIEVNRLTSGANVKLVQGAGTVTLSPTEASVRIKRADFERSFPLTLGSIVLDVAPGKLGSTLTSLLAGALLVESLEVRGALADGKLDGVPSATLVGMKLPKARVNELVGREVLLADIKVDGTVSGPADKLSVGLHATANGASVKLSGVLDTTSMDKPGYDLSLVLEGIAPDTLVQGAPPGIKVGTLTVTAKGRGLKPGETSATVTLASGPIDIQAVRIDSASLTARLGDGKVLIDSLRAEALGQSLNVTGTVDPSAKTFQLRATATTNTDKLRAKLADAKLKAPDRLKLVRLVDDLVIDARGGMNLGDLIHVDVAKTRLLLAGGTVTLGASATLVRQEPDAAGKKVRLEGLDADVHLAGISLGQLLGALGRPAPAVAASLSGDLHVRNAPSAPAVTFGLRASLRHFESGPPLDLSIRGDARYEAANVEIVGRRRGLSEPPLLRAHVMLPVALTGDKKGIVPGRAMRAKVDLGKLELAEIYPYLTPQAREKKTLPKGTLELHASVAGAPGSMRGRLHILAEPYALKAAPTVQQRLVLDGTFVRGSGPGGRNELVTELGLWLDARQAETAKGTLRATVDRGPLSWGAKLDLPTQELARLPFEKVKKLGGTLVGSVDVSGTREDIGGEIDLRVRDFKADAVGPASAGARIRINPADAQVTVGLDGAEGVRIASLAAHVGRGGKSILRDIKNLTIGDPKIDVSLDVPPSTFASLGKTIPALGKYPGKLSGRVSVDGTLSVPRLSGGLVHDDFLSISGTPSRIALGFETRKDDWWAMLRMGGKDELAIDVGVQRQGLLGGLVTKKGETEFAVASTSTNARLEHIIPAFAMGSDTLDLAGRVDLDLGIQGKLVFEEKGRRVEDLDIFGGLGISKGHFSLPNTGRKYTDLEVLVRPTLDTIEIDRLSAKESDPEVKGRELFAKASISHKSFKVSRVAAELRTRDWLVFGTPQFGPSDAPRAALSTDARIDVDLSHPIRKVLLDFRALDLKVPDRLLRSHYQESVGTGDVMFVGDPGVVVGKLVPPKKDPPKPDAAPAEKPSDTASTSTPSGLDLVIKIPRGSHVLQAPLDVKLGGELVFRGRGDKKQLTGKLLVEGGEVTIIGRRFTVRDGTVTFSEDKPKGWLDLNVELPLHVATLRPQATGKTGETVKLRLLGIPGQQGLIFSGAANSYLYEVASMTNLGRSQGSATGPDLPSSQTAQGPATGHVSVATFMAVNMPHLLFFDRFVYWSDPYDGPFTYGRFEHLESERYSQDGKKRLVASRRPATPGQSDFDVSVDYLWLNTARVLFGAGLRVGSRLGGGPSVFFEWSSKD